MTTTITRPEIQAAADAAGWDTDGSDGNYMYAVKGGWVGTIIFEETDPYKGKPVYAQFKGRYGNTITVSNAVLDEVANVLTYLAS